MEGEPNYLPQSVPPKRHFQRLASGCHTQPVDVFLQQPKKKHLPRFHLCSLAKGNQKHLKHQSQLLYQITHDLISYRLKRAMPWPVILPTTIPRTCWIKRRNMYGRVMQERRMRRRGLAILPRLWRKARLGIPGAHCCWSEEIMPNMILRIWYPLQMICCKFPHSKLQFFLCLPCIFSISQRSEYG